MRLLNRRSFALVLPVIGVVGASFILGSSAMGQCDVTPPPGSIISPDGCGISPDVNGGCNLTPAAFTDLGSIASGGVMYVAGRMGTFVPPGGTAGNTSRDLDWYLVTAPAGTLLVSLSTANSTSTAQMGNSVIFIKAQVDVANPCLGDFDVGVQSALCPHVQSVTSGAGTHLVVVTVPFETTATAPVYSCGAYLMTLTHTPLSYEICGTSTASCTEVHATGGCNLPACCDAVCGFNPLCCDVGWDAGCVDSAVTTCGLFLYSCAPVAGAPANDCVTSSQLITIGQSNVVAENLLASTDGPGPAVGLCAAAIGKDLWYTIKAPANGALTITTCVGGDATTDSVIELYGLGVDPIVTSTRAQALPDMFIGCIDDSCPDATGAVIVGGPTVVTLIDAVADEYYLIRIGGWYDAAAGGQETADTFVLTIVTSFEYVAFTTGPQNPVTAIATGVLTNLGLSSGCIAATSQQRWLAQPFTVPASATGWDISRMTVKGFVPAGVTNTTMNYVVWSRLAGNLAPRATEQLFAGSVPFPAGYTGGGDNALLASRDIDVAFSLASGNYYLTAYASNPACATVFSNFAWFISAYDGINLIDATGVFNWRSASFPTPGFVRYVGLNGVYAVQAGADPNDLYNTAFDIFGSPTPGPSCPGDYDSNGIRNGADLTTLLSAWGTPSGDITGDGMTNGADLTTLLSGWGACP
ncbi:MAG: hypothetical protein EXS15_06890 [Phycisphaerales bacterium]|nr:hypothetical protein [Phycisphaerales bacterium]